MGRPTGSRNIDWEKIVAKLRQQPNEWLLFPEMGAASLRTIQVIRRRERRALRLDDGVIRCRRKSIVKIGDEITVTLFLSFQPKEK